MRYFFHVLLDSGFITDTEGTELSCEEEAQTEARTISAELQWNFSDRLSAHAVLEVVSEAGGRVLAMPLRPVHCLAACQ